MKNGLKSYAYRTNEYTHINDNGTETKQRDEVVHVKGFKIKGDGAKKITFESISSCIKDPQKEIEVTYREFVRKNAQTIAVENNTKNFRFTFDKRIIRDDFTT